MIRAYRPPRPRVTLSDALVILRAVPGGMLIVGVIGVWSLLAWSVSG
jgi:hypothetical protein